MIDNRKLALVHIVRKELGLRDEEYRKLLKETAGVESARELDDEKFRKLLARFARSDLYTVYPGGLTIRQKLFIKSLAGRMNWSREHLENFLKKYYHKNDIDSLTKKEASGVIESLKSISGRGAERDRGHETKNSIRR